MNHRTDSQSPNINTQSTAKSQKNTRPRHLLGEAARGCLLGGAGFLLGSCPLLFGTAPLGIALLCAASSYNVYILIGLLLAAALHPVGLTVWSWTGIYAFCVILRLCIRFLADPPTLRNGRPCGVGRYLHLCMDSLMRGLGMTSDDRLGTEDEKDYYAGRGGRHTVASASEDHPTRETRRTDIRLFAEHPFLRILTATVTGFAAGLLRVLMGGFHLYDLWGLLVLLLLSPLATFLLISCFGEAGMVLLFSKTPLRDAPFRDAPLRGKAFSDRDGGFGKLTALFHPLPLCSVAFLLSATVFAAGRIAPTADSLFRPDSAMLLGLLITLFSASRLGAIPGVAMGVLCGLAADPRLAPVLILCAGGYALLRGLSHRAGVIGGCLVGGIWCAAVEGVNALILYAPTLLLAVPLYFIAEKLWPALPTSDGQASADREAEELTATVNAAMTAETRAEAQRARLTALSEAFGALSRRFYNLSGQLKNPRMSDLRRMCDETFGEQCAHCRERDTCWGAEYNRTLDLQARLAAQLHTSGRAVSKGLPTELADICPHIDAIADELNRRHARLCEALSHHEKTEIVAADYAAVAALLGDALEADRIEAETMGGNRKVADRIYDFLTELGVSVHGVVVAGKEESGRRRVIVRGVGLSSLSQSPDRGQSVREEIERICGTRLSRPTFEFDGPSATVMTMEPEARLQAAYAGSTVPAGHDLTDPLPGSLTPETAKSYNPPAVCGDHVALFHAQGAYFYALISDGMGSGEDASLTSEICTMFLEKMLAAGNRAEISLRMLNGYIHAKNTGTDGECSATVDLMELDLIDGHAVFAKNGAAPTYVVRDGTVYKLRSRSMPIGILRETSPELLRFRMHPGDVVVMVSDGITQGHDECAWLIDLLASPMPESMDSLRRDIIRRALSAGSEDDLSAIAIRVEENIL